MGTVAPSIDIQHSSLIDVTYILIMNFEFFMLQRLSLVSELVGSKKPNARFGSAISAIGDLNHDGYKGGSTSYGVISLQFVLCVNSIHVSVFNFTL